MAQKPDIFYGWPHIVRADWCASESARDDWKSSTSPKSFTGLQLIHIDTFWQNCIVFYYKFKNCIFFYYKFKLFIHPFFGLDQGQVKFESPRCFTFRSKSWLCWQWILQLNLTLVLFYMMKKLVNNIMFSNKTKSCQNTSVCCANFRHCHVTCLLALIQLEGSLNFKHFWVLNPNGSKIKMSNSHHLFKELNINCFFKRRGTTNQKPLWNG